MGYTALEKMQELNWKQYHLDGVPRIPALPETQRNYGRSALLFIRENCVDMLFDEAHRDMTDSDGTSLKEGQIPLHMQRDLDRLCFEHAIGRFLAAGSREDAFDVYFCYNEIFHPFGTGSEAAETLLRLLAEHETNASTLMNSHRDHYSHSVQVFLLGLALYRQHPMLREAYQVRFQLKDTPDAAVHFLKYWGFTALFHDIGYPFEIAHQQIKSYMQEMEGEAEPEHVPFVSYGRMDELYTINGENLCSILAEKVQSGLKKYNANLSKDALEKALRERGTEGTEKGRFMDHAYFSALLLARALYKAGESFSDAYWDCLCAILLHNSFFKYTIQEKDSPALSLSHEQPLAYLLMLCDELQCWDRRLYGQNSRNKVYPFDFDLRVDETDRGETTLRFLFYFDKTYDEKAESSSNYQKMMRTDGKYVFLEKINALVYLEDLIPDYSARPNLLQTFFDWKEKSTGLYLSDSTYFNLYRLAIAPRAKVAESMEEEQKMKENFNKLSLEYKLSKIARAKSFAAQLETIDCFYTDRTVDYEPVGEFTKEEKNRISMSEHLRWQEEKRAMGWSYGEDFREDRIARERTRVHCDLRLYDHLPSEEQEKDMTAMNNMPVLIRERNGLTVYRMRSRR